MSYICFAAFGVQLLGLSLSCIDNMPSFWSSTPGLSPDSSSRIKSALLLLLHGAVLHFSRVLSSEPIHNVRVATLCNLSHLLAPFHVVNPHASVCTCIIAFPQLTARALTAVHCSPTVETRSLCPPFRAKGPRQPQMPP